MCSSDLYESLNKISFDYAVVEKEPHIQVMRFAGQWKDMGTWNTLTEAMEDPSIGKAILNDTCRNVHVLNELDVPVLCMGLKDVVVSASPEGILVSDKEQSSYIKPFVDKIDQQIMFAEKSWGSFRVLDVEDEISCSADVEVLHGDVDAAAQVAEVLDGLQASPGVVPEQRKRRGEQIISEEHTSELQSR